MGIVDLFSVAGGLAFGFYHNLIDGQFVRTDNEFCWRYDDGVCQYIELYRMVTLYCWDAAGDSFDAVSEEIEDISQRFIEYEETQFA